MNENPWLRIPLPDYEGHMEAAGQTAGLRKLFSEVYGNVRPRRLVVLGCTTGSDFDGIDPTVTEVAVGVDINPQYLEAAGHRLAARGRRVQLVCGDVLDVRLPQTPFDLVHAALLLEYVDPAAVFRRVHGWMSPTGCFSIISQEPLPNVAAVSSTGYESLRALSGHISLRSADEIEAIGAQERFARQSSRALRLPDGKVLMHSIFQAVRIA